ncbi:MAG TPA: hypothetical protein VNN08_08965 [Thermoanaerobaculia bacterium]|nr:hypothetical protein [Thermoanaerobaculia bacterium]
MLARILLTTALIIVAPTQALAASDVAARYAQTFRRVDRRCNDWQHCTDRDLPRMWRLAGEYLASQLTSRPDLAADDLVAAVKQLDAVLSGRERHAPAIDATATKLGNGDFVITLQYFETGTVLIVGSSRGGAAHIKWSIASVLRCWRASCGPYFAGIRILPSARNGDARFLVEAVHGGNGVTVSAQTSAWRWDGSEAHLLAIDQHFESLEDYRQTSINGDVVIVPTKELAHSFNSFGGTREPAGTWRLRLTANGAKNLGHQWVSRDLRWADDFFFALTKGRAVDRFATPIVARELLRHFDDFGGMVTECQGDGQTLRLVMAEGPSLTFTFDARREGLYAVTVRFDGR